VCVSVHVMRRMQREERRENCACLIRVGHPKQLSDKTSFRFFFPQTEKKAHHEGFSSDALLRSVLGLFRERESSGDRVRRVSRELLSQGVCFFVFIRTRA
jgi:hypothetical protein